MGRYNGATLAVKFACKTWIFRDKKVVSLLMNVLIGMSSSKRGDVCVGPLVPTPHYAQPFCLSIQSDISESNVCMCEVIINGFLLQRMICFSSLYSSSSLFKNKKSLLLLSLFYTKRRLASYKSRFRFRITVATGRNATP